MRKISVFLAVVVMLSMISISSVFSQKLQSETTFQYDTTAGGVSIQRIQLDDSTISVKYDSKVDLTGKNKVNDVLGVYFNNTVKTENFSLDLGFIKLGDWDKQDQGFIDIITNTKLSKYFNLTLEGGWGISSSKAPREYVLGRIHHSLFTVEALVMSDYGISNPVKDRYYWAAVHPKYVFLAAGSDDVSKKTWVVAGSKDSKDFGILGCGDYDRSNGNFWVRIQGGIEEVNQKFFCLDNYLFSTSYLVTNPFFYTRFSPIIPKGNYGIKFDGIKTGNFEKYEFLVSHKFGSLGGVAIGWEREVPHSNGVILEYYKEIKFGKFNASVETKYESMFNRLSGFIRCSLTL